VKTRLLLAVAFVVTAGSTAYAEGGFIGRWLEYYRNRPYPVDHFAPGHYGYNLDDQSRGYFGGGRYTEYYNYGRGGGFSNLANFPGPVPGPAWLYDHKNWIVTEPVRPFLATPPVQAAPLVKARLTVSVPADATVWLMEQPMTQTGTVRQFVTPVLEANVAYTYTVRAQWFDGQQQVEQTKTVPVQAGQTVLVNFP